MTTPELQQHLYDLEEKLLHPDRTKDRATLIPLLAEEFMEFCSTGRVANREQAIEFILNRHPHAATIHYYVMTPICDTAAFATYRVTTTAAVTHHSSLWVFRENRWQLFFHQGTGAA